MRDYENADDKDSNKIYEKIKSDVMTLLKHPLRPEFLNRIDEIIVFKPLSQNKIRNSH
jgi:ATP-dependent Clp protease ATP-binding subunit ClpB